MLLTHFHFDHIMELPFLLELLLQELKKPFNVFASKSSIDSLYSNVFNYECWPDIFELAEKENIDIKLSEFNDYGQFEIAGFNVIPVPVNHTITSHGFLIDSGENSIAFSGDTYLTDSFWEECNKKHNLKAVIIDVSFPSFMKESAEITKHLSTDLLPAEINKLTDSSVQIYVSHMKPQFEKEIREEISSYSGDFNIEFLEDGMILEI